MRLAASNLISLAVGLAALGVGVWGLVGLRHAGGRRRLARGLAFPLGVAVACVAMFGVVNDGLDDALARDPAAALVYPRGHLYGTERTGSAGHAGALIERVYGITDSDAQLDAFFDAALGRLGYTRVASGAAGREYRHGPVRFLTWTEPAPRQVGGRLGPVVGAPYTRVLWTRVTNQPPGRDRPAPVAG